MVLHINGIHHITAIASDPQKNIDFYAGVLGLRMIKKTVNFDAPDTYHFYYADKIGSPGTVLTFFPWGKGAWRGRPGTGQVTAISFAIPAGSMPYWINRLQEIDMDVQEPTIRFGEEVLTFRDPDGIQLELIASREAIDENLLWDEGPVPVDHAIAGFHHATLAVENPDPSLHLLMKNFGYEISEQTGNRFRLKARNARLGGLVDVVVLPAGNRGKMGAGTVHHIAWRAANDDIQLKKRDELITAGFQVTPVVDRNYFHSIYFREPGNILYEIATDGPGFLVDESIEELGSQLRLPAWYESRRPEIESILPSVKLPEITRKIFQE